MFLPHSRVKVSIVGSLRDREVACSASDRQCSNFVSCVGRTVSSQSSDHPQKVLLPSLAYMCTRWPKARFISFHFLNWWTPFSVAYSSQTSSTLYCTVMHMFHSCRDPLKKYGTLIPDLGRHYYKHIFLTLELRFSLCRDIASLLYADSDVNHVHWQLVKSCAYRESSWLSQFSKFVWTQTKTLLNVCKKSINSTHFEVHLWLVGHSCVFQTTMWPVRWRIMG